MAYFNNTEAKAAGNYLLAVLKTESPVPYSRFYDGTDGTHDALLREMGLTEEECESPECAMDEAVYQLEQAGLVATSTTGDLLQDGNPDYEIRLTDKGRTFLASGGAFEYRYIDPYNGLVPILPWRPRKDDPDHAHYLNEEFSPRSITLSLKSHRRKLEEGQFGAVPLDLGSAILVFGKRPPGVDDPDDALLRRELALVRDGLAGAGAEELCHLRFGGGYLVLVKPLGIPLYDAATVVGAEQLWQEHLQFLEVGRRLADLACQASKAVYGASDADSEC